jgi:transcription elongation factor Elf1
MSWERDPLVTKSKLFFERAFNEQSESPLFGLWCSMGLELLARAALASISPTLLAEPVNDHRFLLHALNRGSAKVPRRSIKAAQVLGLCSELVEGFSGEDFTSAMALVNRRNDELHTGAAAFDEYPSKIWLSGFYRACNTLAKAIGETLEGLFGEEQAKIASEILGSTEEEVKKRVLDLVSKFQKSFEAKSAGEKEAAKKSAEKETGVLVHRRHHKVTCPACGSDATVEGQIFGPERVTHDSDMIVVRQSVSPHSFACSACGLKLESYGELHVVGLGGQYTRTNTFSPEDYYGLIDPETADLSEYMDKYLQDYFDDMAAGYDNE